MSIKEIQDSSDERIYRFDLKKYLLDKLLGIKNK